MKLFLQLYSYYTHTISKNINERANGGVEALSPRSVAYSDFCQTNVTSYAIAGSWKPNATEP
jgi:hypothetical protein